VRTFRLGALWRVPSPTQPVVGWHVSPLIDALAYHWSWLWAFVPLWLSGPRQPQDYLGLYLVVLTLNVLHRHFTLPLIALDSEIFERHATRFSVVPTLLFLGFLATPLLSRFEAPRGFFGARLDQAAVRRAIAERLGGSQGHFWSRIARKVKRGGAKLPPPE
jgi:hypothetical protein